MKKQSILSLVALVAIFMFTSCNKTEPKEVKLSNMNDSINYTLGLANGDQIKSYYMTKDSSDKPIKALIEALEKAYKSGDKDEMYNLGLQIGTSLKQQEKHGIMGDSTLNFDTKMIKQGLINALNGYKEGMTPEQAKEYIQKTMTKIQNEKMMKQAPAQAPQGQPAPSPAPQPAN